MKRENMPAACSPLPRYCKISKGETMSVKVVEKGTALVSKNLAEAQFKCIECCKAFISFKHLAKHALKRHGTPLLDPSVEAISRERKLSDATGRLENVISLLESKTNDFGLETSKLSRNKIHDDSDSGRQKHCENHVYLFPENATDCRKPVSVFTLPNNQEASPFLEFLKGGNFASIDSKKTTSNIPQEDDAEFEQGLANGDITLVAEDGTTMNISRGGHIETVDSGCQAQPPREQSQLEPLLLNLIDKLDGVLLGHKEVTSSFCQTNAEPMQNVKKLVHFADCPAYVDSDASEGPESSREEKLADQSVGEDDIQAKADGNETIESLLQKAQEDYESDGSQNSSAESTDDKNEPVEVENERRENSVCEVEGNCFADQEEPIAEKTKKPIFDAKHKSSIDFENTKQKILEVVEKCVNEIKSKRKMSKINNPVQTEVPNGAFRTLPQGMKRHSEDAGGCYDAQGVSAAVCNIGPIAICEGRENILVSPASQGILLPLTVMCRDTAEEIDDLSGNSYDQFMKRFRSLQMGVPSKENTDDVSMSHSEDESDGAHAANGRAINNGRLVGPGNASAKNQDHDVLREEPTQVQHLMDTLVTDLQRWRTARQSQMSESIRMQLEERLASNLNLLGIHGQTKSLSDDAAAIATSVLEKRRSKAIAKDVAPTYFESLKAAYQTELDRIAKSRTTFQFTYRTPDAIQCRDPCP